MLTIIQVDPSGREDVYSTHRVTYQPEGDNGVLASVIISTGRPRSSVGLKRKLATGEFLFPEKTLRRL